MEEIIELESSDEEQGPPPGKKKRPNQPISTNIMVNIPHGVTIKPVRKKKDKEVPKISNVTTINKTKTQARSSQAKVAPVIRAVKRPAVFSKISPESQALKKLPPCVTVTKTGPSVEHTRTPKKCIKKVNHVKIPNLSKVVELDREATPSKKPRWYARPEESEASPDKINNKNAFIEIVIEDSPVKPKTKQVRKVSNENVITIDDSPNKPQPINPGNDEGSDEEPTASRKVPHSKKKLEYKDDTLSTIVEEKTYEIEIDPIAVDEPNIPRSGPYPLNVTFNNAKDQELEIAQDEVTVILNEPIQAKKKKEVCSKDTEDKEFHPVYLQFIDLCLKLENSDDMTKIVDKKIKTYYRQVPKAYTHSEDFIEMVSSKISSIKANPKEMYLYIKDIVDDLNMQRKFVKQMPIQEAKSYDEETFTRANDEMEPNKKKQIRKLEKSLKKFNTAIKKLEMQEVDFDDEDGSVYLLTEKYKERIVRIHAKLCQLTNTKMPSEPRLVLNPGPSRAPGPARRLEEWINKKKVLAFPDFHDVLRCVRAANTEDNLGWSEATVMEEARDLFCRCGKKLQRRRQEREWRLATSRLTVDADPAEESDELKKRLEDNRRLARTNESEVFNKFSDMQNYQNLEAEEIDDKDAEESPIESDDEDNDENSTLENKEMRKDILKKLLKEQAKKSSTEPSNTEETPEKIEDRNTELSEPLSVDDDRNSGSDEIGSDVDELHLLQKLRSDNVIHGVSSSESSDLGSPIAISDTLESSSDESIISIALSSDGDSPQNSKTDTISNDAMDENVGEKTSSLALKNKNEIVLSPDPVVDLDSDTAKSKDITKLSRESKSNKIAEEKKMSDMSNDALVLSPDTVVVLDSDTTKSEEINTLSKESKKNKIAEEKTLSETPNDALFLSPDTVVDLDSDTTKSEDITKLSRESKSNKIAEEKKMSEMSNDALVLSPDTVVDLDSDTTKSEDITKLSRESKSNKIAEEKKMSETPNDALVLSPDTVVDLDSDTTKSEDITKLSRESKSNKIAEEKKMSETPNDALFLSPDTVVDLDSDTTKSEDITKLSRESKSNKIAEEKKMSDMSNDALVLSPDTVVDLDSDTTKSEDITKLSRESKSNKIAEEKKMSEMSNDALVLSPDTVVDLDSDSTKSEEINTLSKESKKNKIAEEKTMSETPNDALFLSPDTVVDLDSDTTKSEDITKLSRESKSNKIAEEKKMSEMSNDALVLSPDTVVVLDSDTTKSEDITKLSRESKRDKIAEEKKMSETPNDALVLSPDTVVVLDLDTGKSEEPNNLSIGIKDNNIVEKTPSENCNGSECGNSEETNRLLRESKDNIIAEKTTSENTNEALFLSPDTLVDLDAEAAKSEETNKLSKESKDDIAEQTRSKTSNDESPDATLDLDLDAEESEATNKVSRESKDKLPETTTNITSNDAVVLSDAEVLSHDRVVALGADATQSEETNKLLKESNDDIAEKASSKTSNDVGEAPIELDLDAAKSKTTNKLSRDSKDNIPEITTNITSNDAVALSPDTVELDTEAPKSKETDSLSRDSKDNTIPEKTDKTSNEQKTPASVLLNVTETVSDKHSDQNTETNREKCNSETLKSIEQAGSSSTSGVNDTSEIEVTCDDTTHVDSNNAKFVCVPDLLQTCAGDDEATSNDLRSPAGSPIPVQDLMRRIDELC